MLAMESFLRHLKSAGVDYLFANPGTDFPPVAEAYGRCAATPEVLPRSLLVAHENTAIAMAHGFYLASGRPAAVMCHTNVGTANAICGILNACKDNIPIVLMAGRTPFTAQGYEGSRSGPIHWGQEMYDQAGMLREAVKWDYEWKLPDQAGALAVRCLEMAMAHPRGPVYLTLPREVIAQDVAHTPVERIAGQSEPSADDGSVRRLADMVAAARMPLIITSAVGRDAAAVQALAALAEQWRIPVVENSARYMNFPADHPMHYGYDSTGLVGKADLVITVESEVPWIPGKAAPMPDTKVVCLDIDPLFHSYPLRGYPADLYIAGKPADTLSRLLSLLRGHGSPPLRRWPEPSWRVERSLKDDDKLSFASASSLVSEVVDEDTVVINEYPLQRAFCPLNHAGSYFGHAPAGGLGWGFGASLGYKLADPEKRVIATLGDGSYIFANPVASHMAAREHGIAVLVVVFNNGMYGAVRKSTLGMYPKGAAAADDGMFLAGLGAAPDLAELARTCGAHAQTVTTVGQMRRALKEAAVAVAAGMHALVNVQIGR